MPQTTLRAVAGFLAVALAVAAPRITASETSLPTLSPSRVGAWAEPHLLAALGREGASVPGVDVAIGPLAELERAHLPEELPVVAIGPHVEPNG